jgi:microcystin degradation protein MlrC
VISHRVQCADPIFFEMMGLDIAWARSVVVKSRGHFRGGFDEFFRTGPDRRSRPPGPHLADARLPRPVIPLDDNVEWVRPQR